MMPKPSRRFTPEECALLVVDMQDRFMPRIHEHERIIARCVRLIEGAKMMDVPIVITEQYRKGLGATVPEIEQALADGADPLDKLAFGCLDDEPIRSRIADLNRPALVICGIEAHACVMQTVLRALDEGFRVLVVEDCISSHRVTDRETAIARMRQAGAIPMTFEMILLEWLRFAGTDRFKQAMPLLKD